MWHKNAAFFSWVGLSRLNKSVLTTHVNGMMANNMDPQGYASDTGEKVEYRAKTQELYWQ